VGALLQNRLSVALHDRAVTASAQLPSGVRGQFVAGFSNAASGGLEVGAGQTGTAAGVPHDVPASLAAQLSSISHDVFGNAFVDAMRPTLILPIAVIAVAAVGVLTARRGPLGIADMTEYAGVPAADQGSAPVAS